MGGGRHVAQASNIAHAARLIAVPIPKIHERAIELDREMIVSLQARCAMFKGLLLACASNLPPEWGLTRTEERVVGALMNGAVADSRSTGRGDLL